MSTVLSQEWKQEPLSPLGFEEAWLTEDSFYQTALKFETELGIEEDDDCKNGVTSQILDGFENLMNIDELIKEEPFLLDEKMLPLLDVVEPPRATLVHIHPAKAEVKRTPDTESLLKEFETVYDVVEFKYGTLTPPQSPPSQPVFTPLEPVLAQPTYTTLPEKQQQQQQQTIVYPVPDKPLITNGIQFRGPIDFPQVNTPQPDIAHELAVVDELVRTRVEDMQWNSSSSSSGRSSPSSSRSSFGDYSSDDPEWMPDSIDNDAQNIPQTKTQRKRSKPYSRTSTEDKKSRKKEQNKNAATRYRMKKKAEVEEILSEERALQNKNEELSNKITDVQREIKYLKGLMRDLFKAKGLIN